jgi:hypothetical protein
MSVPSRVPIVQDKAATGEVDSIFRGRGPAGVRLELCQDRGSRSFGFSQAQAIELTLAVCLFNFMNRFNDTMWLELEEGAPPGPRMHIEPSAFRRYATTMLKGV